MDSIKVDGLWKSFKIGFIPRQVTILKDVSFSVKAQRVTGFVGANGSGKTTILKCLLGTLFPDRGKITFFGNDELSAKVKAQIGFLPEHPYFYDFLTGNEFLQFHMRLLPPELVDKRNCIDEVLDRVGLLRAKDVKLRSYSKGMLQRIGIAQSILHKPKLLILDEPMSGLDPDGRFEVAKIISQVAEAGTTIFFSSHLLHDAQKLCHDLVVIKEGRQIYNGALAELLVFDAGKYVLKYFDGNKDRQISGGFDEIRSQMETLVKQGFVIKELTQEKMDLELAFQQFNQKKIAVN